jgi:hypothetical protein
MNQNLLGVTDIEHFHWSLSEADVPASVELENKPVSVPAAVELAIIEANSRKVHSTAPPFSSTNNSAMYSAVKSANWPLVGKASKVTSGDTTVVVLPTLASEETGWWTKQLLALREQLVANGFSSKLAGALTGGVGEMVDNAWSHSSCDDPALLVYQVRSKKFAFSVADLGVGVLESLSKNPKYDFLRSSMEAISFAIQPGVSRLDNGGMGFATMLQSMAELWGNARIRSGEASLIIDRTQETTIKNFIYLPQLPGLHVSARCSVEAPATLSEQAAS